MKASLFIYLRSEYFDQIPGEAEAIGPDGDTFVKRFENVTFCRAPHDHSRLYMQLTVHGAAVDATYATQINLPTQLRVMQFGPGEDDDATDV